MSGAAGPRSPAPLAGDVNCLVLLMVLRSQVEARLAVTMAGREPTLQTILWASNREAWTLEREHGVLP